MMRSGIMRLSEGGTPGGMTPQMAADFVEWFIGRFGHGKLGPESWNSTKIIWLREGGYETHGDSLKDYFPEADWGAYINYVTGGGTTTPSGVTPGTGLTGGETTTTTTTTTPTETEPTTVFEAGSDLPSPIDYEEGAVITIGDIIYTLKNNFWSILTGGSETEDYGTDSNGDPLPDPNGYEYGEGGVYEVGDDIYVVLDGKWEQVSGSGGAGDLFGLGTGKGGLFGLGIGPWLKDFFGATGAGGDFLSGIFGQDGNIEDLIKLFFGGKSIKEAWDAIQYEVPTGQGAAMSEFEKANPFTGNMTLAGMAPNYLQGQDYGIPVGEQGIPAATHTIGTPYAEEIASGQRGGIMNTKGHVDVIPALLEPDEFVFTRKAVQNMGGGDARQGAKKMYSIMKNLEGMR